jgi:hypothetical protein
VDIKLHISLTWTLVGGKWSVSRSSHFTQRKNPHYKDLVTGILQGYTLLTNRDDDVSVMSMGVRLHLLTVATIRPTVHPLRDIWAWKTQWNNTAENSWFVHQSSPAILPAQSSERKAGKHGKGSDELHYKISLSYSYSSLIHCKI